MIKLNVAAKGTFWGILWLVVMGVILAISAYSLYFVARHLGVPKVFAMGFSTAYDGTALLAAYKSLQYAQEGRSGSAPRLVMIVFVGVSAWLNSLHSILGGESPLAIPMWAGLPVAAATVFELHTSQARAKAMARLGKKYPSPLPSWGGVTWVLFPFATVDKLRDYVCHRAFGLSRAQLHFLKEERKDWKRRGVHDPDRNASPAVAGGSASFSATELENATRRYEGSAATGGSASRPFTGIATGSAPGSATPGSGTGTGPRPASPAPDSRPGPILGADATGPATGDGERVTGAATGGATGSGVIHLPSNVAGSATRECEQCGESFVPLRRTARYCGGTCRVAACRARKAAQAEEEAVS